MAEGQDRTASGPPPKPGLIGQILGLVGRALAWLVLAWLLAFTIECCGVLWWWPEEGVGHSRRLLAAELVHAGQQPASTNLLIRDPQAFVRAGADRVWALWEAIGLLDFIQQHRSATSSASGTPSSAQRFLDRLPAPALPAGVGQRFGDLQAHLADGLSRLPLLLYTLVSTSQVFVVRLAILVLSLPVFMLAGLVGAIEGLSRRDLRRWGGGRESSFLHRHALAFVFPSVAGAWLVYLAGPWSIPPAFVVLPFAVSFAVALAVSIGSFKKYL